MIELCKLSVKASKQVADAEVDANTATQSGTQPS